jgi:hypothetical protein
LHAEDIGWPPKKTGETLSAKKSTIVAVDFSVNAEEMAYEAVA